MKWLLTFLRDTRHLWVLLAIIVIVTVGFLVTRNRMIPESFGQQGPYRSAALAEIAAQPSVLQADAVCLECHEEVGEEREEALHKSVGCIHCHGLGRAHVAQARKAAETPDLSVEPAEEWDGNFLTNIDLYITQDRATCVACHEAVVGMPEEFMKINVEEHLDEMGAEELESREVCFECHAGHNTAHKH